MGDPGLFGPASVTWRVHSHPAGLIGGLRALMIQALNPRAMRAVADFSDYQTDPWGRLRRTSRYLTDTVFGDTETAQRAAARVRSLHRRIHGYDPVTRSQYRADDPELLLWIHAVEVHSFVSSYRAYAGRLTDEEADAYVAEMVQSAELIGLHREDVPSDMESLTSYLRGVDGLVLTPEARAGLNVLMAPPMPVYLRPLWAVPIAAAVAILPRRVRDLYGLPWLEPAAPLVRGVVRILTTGLHIVMPPPPPVRAAFERAATAETAWA